MQWDKRTKQKRLTLWLPLQIHTWLKNRSKEYNITMSKLIRRIIIELMIQDRSREE